MNHEEDDNFDFQLRDHFARKLDGQLGRGTMAFTGALRTRSWRKVGFLAALAAAALVVIGIGSGRFSIYHPKPQLTAIVSPSTQTSADTPVEYNVSWQTTDEGTVFLDDAPLRSIRRQRFETLTWIDPDTHAHVELSVPQEEIVYVAINAN